MTVTASKTPAAHSTTPAACRVPGTQIPCYVFESNRDLARHVAQTIATIIRERNAFGQKAVLGLPTGSTPLGVYRELIRMHREEGLDFSQRHHLQSRRIPRSAARSSCKATIAGCSRTFSTMSTSRRRTSTCPTARCRWRMWKTIAGVTKMRSSAAGGIDLQLLGHRPQRPHRLQRAVQQPHQPHATGHARPGNPQRRRQRLLQRGARSAPGHHHGGGHDPRRPQDHPDCPGRAQGRHHSRIGRGCRRAIAFRPACCANTAMSTFLLDEAASARIDRRDHALGSAQRPLDRRHDQTRGALAFHSDRQGPAEARRPRLPRTSSARIAPTCTDRPNRSPIVSSAG